MSALKISSSDGVSFEISSHVLKLIPTLENMLAFSSEDSSELDIPIQFESGLIRKCIKYCELSKNANKCSWVKEQWDLDPISMTHVIETADFLGIESLKEELVSLIVSKLKSMTDMSLMNEVLGYKKSTESTTD